MASSFSRGFTRCSRIKFTTSYLQRTNHALQRKLHINKGRTGLLAFLPENRKKQQSPLFLRQNDAVCSLLLSKLQLGGARLNSSSASAGSEFDLDSATSCESDGSVIDPLFISDSSVTDSISAWSADGLISAIEPSFTSIGLGCHYTPVGVIQTMFESLHMTCGLPWWEAIIIGTCALRLLMLPLVIKSQVNTARLKTIQPEVERIQTRMKELSNTHDNMAKAAASYELQKLFKDNNCNPIKALITPLVQLPVFISFFLAIRRMADLPVESMKTGGLLWFPDLVAFDPVYALPVIASASMLLVMEVGAEGAASMPSQQQKMMKTIFRCMSLVIIPLTAKFPAAIFVYWIISNLFSLFQVGLLQLPPVKKWFGIPVTSASVISTTAVSSKNSSGGFWENIKSGYKTRVALTQIQHEEKMRERKFKQISEQPIQQTYENNPRVAKNQELFKQAKTSAAKKRKRRR